MMAYQRDYVLCVLHDGSPVREIHGKVSIPFYSEYKIRLKNKNNKLRAKARVWIDGRKASNLGDFILHPGETLDLERFLDKDMDTGNRFKFVPISDNRVNDPTDPENGIIKVEFYREQEWLQFNWKWDWKPTWPNNPSHPGGWWDVTLGSTTVTYTNPVDYVCDSHCAGSSSGSRIVSCGLKNANVNYMYQPEGATVEGSISNQQFVESLDFITETNPVVLTLKLTPINKITQIPKVTPGKPNVVSSKRFCPECGRRRRRRSDKYCVRCGAKY